MLPKCVSGHLESIKTHLFLGETRLGVDKVKPKGWFKLSGEPVSMWWSKSLCWEPVSTYVVEQEYMWGASVYVGSQSSCAEPVSMCGSPQGFSVSPSPLLALLGLELGWIGLGLGLGGLGTQGLGTRA